MHPGLDARQADFWKTAAVLLDGQARQIASAVAALLDKKNKYVTLDKLYPTWFGRQAGAAQMTKEQQEAAFQQAFRAFPGR